MIGGSAEKMALARKREADALNLRLAGATYDAIAKQIGLASPGAAQKAFERSLERLAPVKDREEARALEAARLDRMQIAHWQKAVSGDPGATETVLRIMARRARLLGLDAPVDVNLNLFLKLIAELRELPESDLLEVLGYAHESVALPEHTEE